MVCIRERPRISYGRSLALHFRYLTCLLDRGHITNYLVRQPLFYEDEENRIKIEK